MREVKFSEVLKQYKIYHFVEDNTEYRQVTISMHTGVSFRGTKLGKDIGRKRQFVIDLEEYPNTFIFTRQGVQNGSYGIAPKEVHGCVVTENMPMFSIEPTLNPEYLEYYLQTNHFQDQLQALNASGSAQKSIHEKVLLQLNILLPDIEEQKSIVDEIKAVENKQSKVLEELQTQSELINKLRSSILSDAVSGKLVPQDPNDESAEVLLEKIKAEKEKLIKEGKIKKQKLLPPISEDEISYKLPNRWVFTKIGEISNYGTLEKKKPTQIQNGDWILELEDIDKETSNINKKLYYPERIVKSEKNIFYTNYILYSKLRPYLNKVVVAEDNGVCTSEIIPFHSFGYINPFFLQLILKSKEFVDYANNSTHGMNLPRVGTEIVRNYIFGLPPIEEQKRIVEKVEKLMATCDALELEVQNSKRETEKLMQSVLKEAFAR